MKVFHVISYVSQAVSLPFYANEFPEKSHDDCGVVRVEGGQAPDLYVAGLKSPSIQILVRHEKGSEAERISHDIWKLFHDQTHYSIGSTFVYVSKCDQSEPIFVGKDKNARTIYSVNVSCKTSD